MRFSLLLVVPTLVAGITDFVGCDGDIEKSECSIFLSFYSRLSTMDLFFIVKVSPNHTLSDLIITDLAVISRRTQVP